MVELYSHCSYCGAAYREALTWPRTCQQCGNIAYRNPIPVTVVLLPFKGGILTVRRAIQPGLGKLALPGGFVNFGETWQEAGAREVWEETGVRVDPNQIQEFRVRSAPDGTLILFGLAQPHPADDLPPFISNDEASERVIVHTAVPMAFSLHTEMLRLFFAASMQNS